MKIIISPAKKMKIDEDFIGDIELPIFLKESEKIAKCIKKMSYDEVKNIWKTNDTITNENIERFKYMDLNKNLTPAIFSYEGIQYQYMSVISMDNNMLDYIQKNLRILSGFYGVLRPLDAVTPYRLEMQSKISIGKFKNLYDFWGDKLYKELIDESRTIVNLASKEYSKCIEKYLRKKDIFVNCSFYEMSDGKLAQKGTYAKMARGEMVRFMAENKIDNLEDIKHFNSSGYKFFSPMSNDREYFFIKEV